MKSYDEQSVKKAIDALNTASPFANELYGNINRRPEDVEGLKSYVGRLCSDRPHQPVNACINDYIHKMQEVQLSSIKKNC